MYEDLRNRLLERNDYKSGGAPNDADLERVTELFDHPLPESYIEYLRTFGWIELGSLELFGIGAGIPDFLNVVKITISERLQVLPSLPFKLAPVFNDGFGNFVCIDSENNDRLVLFDHESALVSEYNPSFYSWLYELT